jgi:agmatine deiminase
VPECYGPGEATPRSLGFLMPAEWEKQEGIWISWPEDEGTFPDLRQVEQAYTRMIRSVCPHEKIHLLVRDPSIAEYVTGLVRDRKIWRHNLKFHLADYADVWFRDYGPSFVIHRKEHLLAMVDWTFNAWGNKYPDLLDDDTIPMLINKEIGIPRFIPGIVMEGGSIDVNGCGTVLTTEQCLLNPNRNPTLDRPGIEWYLEEYLGCSHVVWLKEGIGGDDTDGHVDDIARFVNATTILCALEEDPEDENYAPLRENYQVLKSATDQKGKPITVIPIPMPGETFDDTRLPASYANFLITNKVVLLPTFHHPNDRIAATILEGVFPGREVIGIDCRAMVRGLGTLHCISQQQPKP